MNYTTIKTLGVLILCAVVAGCGSDGETTDSTGVDTSTGTGGGNGGGTPTGNAGRLQFSAPSITVAENAGNATVSVTRTEGTAGAVSVTVTTSNGSATQPQDYTAVSTTVTFAAGDAAAKTVNIPIVNDTAAELGETFTITLSAPTGSATLGSPYQALITITDDDIAAPAAPKTALSSAYKQLKIDWTAATGATSYRVMKDATGSGTFAQVGTDLPASARSTEVNVIVHQEDWLNVRYAIAACNSAGCTQSPSVTAAGLSVPLIGYLKAPETISYSSFGSALALSADGSTLAVSVDETTDPATPSSGFVHVYTRSGNDWAGPVTLQASNADDYDYFGSALALSSDGNTLVVGAPYEASGNGTPTDNSVAGAGAAYIFTRAAGGTWTQAAYLKSAETPSTYENFGASVAISPDGSVVAAGVPYRSITAGPVNYAGVIYTFALSGGTWTRTGPITAPTPAAFSYFGSSIALSDQGTTLVVGAPQQEVSALQGAGSAFVYTRAGGNWTYARTLVPSVPVQYSRFGSSMSIAHDGSRVAIGAQDEDLLPASAGDPTYYSAGAAYLFDLSASGATQTARLIATNPGLYGGFSQSLALSGDGETLVVGATGEDGSGAGVDPTVDDSLPSAGAAYVFTRSGTTWSQRTYLKASGPRMNDLFGASVAVSGDGSAVAVGSPYEDSGATGFNGTQVDDCGAGDTNCVTDSGAVYLY
ncbi:Calx-beta domain-containing protein [Povalibacter sp.]|uniref:Calx-beta domain-containing protein n=1 Tax=Povalibacter sp. TaxID=1962978 RepID=UPI002F3F0FB6